MVEMVMRQISGLVVRGGDGGGGFGIVATTVLFLAGAEFVAVRKT